MAKSGAEPGKAGDQGVHQVLATTQERVAEILEATDRAATEIMQTAKAEAERVVAEAHEQATAAVNAKLERVSGLIEDVMAKAGTLDGEFEQLRGLVRESTAALAQELGVAAPAGPDADSSSPAPARPAAEDPAASKRRPQSFEDAERQLAQTIASVQEQVAELDDNDDRAEAVKLLAIQMIATGHSAERASERLKSEFHVEDPEAVLASIGAPLPER